MNATVAFPVAAIVPVLSTDLRPPNSAFPVLRLIALSTAVLPAVELTRQETTTTSQVSSSDPPDEAISASNSSTAITTSSDIEQRLKAILLGDCRR